MCVYVCVCVCLYKNFKNLSCDESRHSQSSNVMRKTNEILTIEKFIENYCVPTVITKNFPGT